MASMGVSSNRPESMNWDTMEGEFPALFLESPLTNNLRLQRG